MARLSSGVSLGNGLLGASTQHKLFRLSNGNTLALQFNGGITYKVSTDNGVNFGAVQSLATSPSASIENFAAAIDEGDNLHIVYINESGTLDSYYYARYTPDAGRTAWTLQSTSVKNLTSDGNNGYMDILAHREGTGWAVHVVTSFYNGGNGIRYYPITVAADGTVTVGTPSGFQGSGGSQGITSIQRIPNSKDFLIVWFQATISSVTNFAKLTYSEANSTWSLGNYAQLSQGSTFLRAAAIDSQGRMVVAAQSSTTGIELQQVDSAGVKTAIQPLVTTGYTLTNNSANMAVEFDHNDDPYFFYVESNALKMKKYTRSTAAWSAATTLIASGVDSISMKRGWKNGKLEFLVRMTAGAVYYYFYDFGNTPSTPPTNNPKGTSASPAIITANTPTFDWSFLDSDVWDTQSAYQVCIKLASNNSIIHDTGKVLGSLTEYQVPGGVLSKNVVYYWQVKTWDQADSASGYSSAEYFKIVEQAAVNDVYTFNYTGAEQTFIVPANVTQMTIEAYGAEGGSVSSVGGKGGYAKATYTVTPGETLKVFVGGKGGNGLNANGSNGANTGGARGWNGGGLGGNGNSVGGGGGGGASDVRRGTFALADRIIVAGGGGGAGAYINISSGGFGSGDSSAGSGTGSGNGNPGGGANGTTAGISYGSAAGLGVGGDGQYTGSSEPDYGYGGGGGGGGYYGGGGGTNSSGYGGGGGNGYTGTGTSVATTDGVRVGNGQVIMTVTQVSTAPTFTGRTPGSTDQTKPTAVGTTTPIFAWNYSGAFSQSKYQLKVYDANNALVHDTGALASAAKTYAMPAGVLAAGRLYGWEITATDNNGVQFTSNRLYMIIGNVPTVEQTFPKGTNGSPAGAGMTPKLQWSYSDTDGDAQSAYNVVIETSSGSLILDTGFVTSPNKYYDVPKGLLNGGQVYRWKVTAKDATGLTSNSTGYEYFITNNLPDALALVTPTDTYRTPVRPVFIATIGDDIENDGQKFVLQLAEDSDFTVNVSTYESAAAPVGWEAKTTVGSFGPITGDGVTSAYEGGQIRYTMQNDLVEGHTYYWRMAAVDGSTGGQGAWSSVRSIRVGNVLQFQEKPFKTSVAASRVVFNAVYSMAKDGELPASLKVEVSNNAFDSAPTWEDATAAFLGGTYHQFANNTKTASEWGISVRVTVIANDTLGTIQFDAIGYSFD